MTRILITCSRPGFRRGGIEHPARKVYAPGELTDRQIELLKAEPLVTLVELPEGGEDQAIDGQSVRRELAAHVALARSEGASLDIYLSVLTEYVTREWNTQQGASGTAREAPSAGSGSDALQASDGVQPAPPSTIPEAQQPADAEGQQAEPEPGQSDQTNMGAEAEEATGVPAAVDPAGTGEVSEAGAAPASDADLVSHGEQATELVSHEAPAVKDNAPAKSRRKGS